MRLKLAKFRGAKTKPEFYCNGYQKGIWGACISATLLHAIQCDLYAPLS